jgi:hypothetical protein
VVWDQLSPRTVRSRLDIPLLPGGEVAGGISEVPDVLPDGFGALGGPYTPR